MLSNQQFDRTRRLALRLAGIELVERHRSLLDSRSRRVGIVDSSGLDSLLSAAERGETAATQQMLGLLTTKYTGFFRHPPHFEVAADHAMRAARQRGQARLWSAGVATGEEPYSLAMALIEGFGHDDPPVKILATDVDVNALEAAQRGEYGETVLRTLEPARRNRFLKGTDISRRWRVVPALRRLVEFRALNLASVTWPVDGSCDVIFCRNVLMYLEPCHRYAALERMATLLAPDGLLLLDPAEHLGKAGHLFTAAADGVCRRRRVSPPRDPVTRSGSVPRS